MSALTLIDTAAAAPRQLLSKSVKTEKGLKVGVGTAVMYLAPANLSGRNVCPMATAECRAACLYDSGMLRYRASQAAQLARTLMLYRDRPAFLAKLEHEIALHEIRCNGAGLICAVRLNGTSDLRWERIAPDLFARFPRIRFYDYTKLPNRRDLPRNYSLTFSLAETDKSWLHHELALETMNVAVVLAGCGSTSVRNSVKPFPKTWNGRKLIDGDKHDVRFADRPRAGAYVGLRPKGDALKLQVGGFVKDAFYV